MKRILLISILSFMFLGFSYEDEEYYLTFKNTERQCQAIYGIKQLATNRIDTALGEFEVPPSPGGVLGAVFYIYDSLDGDDGWYEHYSYKDYRPVLNDDDSVIFKFRVFNQNASHSIEWGIFSQYVAKATLYANLPLNVELCDMLTQNSFQNNDPSLEIFWIKLIYSKSDAVDDDIKIKNEETISIHPNPCNNILKLSSEKEISSIEIINSNGVTISEQLYFQCSNMIGKNDIFGTEVDVTSLPLGIYFLKTVFSDGQVKCSKFIKL